MSKPGRSGIVCIVQQLNIPADSAGGANGTSSSAASTQTEIVKVSKDVRRLLALVLGERVVVEKYTANLDTSINVELGVKNVRDETNGTETSKALLVKDILGSKDADDKECKEFENQVKAHLKEIGLIIPGLEFTVNDKELIVINCGIDLSCLSLSSNNNSEFQNTSNKQDDDYHHQVIAQPQIFNSQTSISFTSQTTHINISNYPSLTTFSSIGGLTKQIKLLQSKIKLPLHYPHLFSRFRNASPDKGFLLHGPPGTGKSMLLRAIAAEMDAHVLTISGPSIVSKYLGETEQALRNVFAEARKYQPGIIIIDELDALVPKRGSDDAGEAESRVVSTLLTLMDGLHEQRGDRVVVVGATNRPGNIDPALRRAGRFGQEIEIGIPDAGERLSILKLQLDGMPHKLSNEYVDELCAKKMHGYVGADIQALMSQCVGLAVDRAIDECLDPKDMYILQQDVDKALLDIRPSAMKEIVLETPKVYWTDIGGQEDVKQKLKETIDWPLSHPETFQRLGVQPPKGILLYGPPGCSKTLTAKALATEAGLNFLAVKGPELFNKYVGESERAVRQVFRKARAAAPSIIFFDEIDALSSSRGGGSGSEGSSDRVLTSLLNEMDGIETLVGVIVLAATNRPDVIDSALMRPGRLDRLIYVGPPDFEARVKILEIQFQKMAVDKSSVDIKYLAQQTEGCSGAEIVQFTQEAGLLAMNESLEIEAVAARHFETALKGIKRGITPEMIEYYEDYDKRGRLDKE